MIDEQGEEQTILFMNKNSERKRIMTENAYNDDVNQKFIPRWQGNNFYHHIKRKIHQKLKTQPAAQGLGLGLFKNKKLNINSNMVGQRPKSKITISTLQIAIDPLERKVEPAFEIERKIYHKVESSVSLIKTKPTKIQRNMSAKLTRDPPPIPQITNSSRELQKKQLIQTCRKNSKVDIGLASKRVSRQFFIEKQKQKQKAKQQQSNKQMEEQQSFFHVVQNNIDSNKELIYLNKLRKSRSQISKQSKSAVKMQTFDTNPLLFYFKTKNTFKPANRQVSIKKLRIKATTNHAYIGML